MDSLHLRVALQQLDAIATGGAFTSYEGLDVSSSGKSAKLRRLPGSEQRVGAVVRANLSR